VKFPDWTLNPNPTLSPPVVLAHNDRYPSATLLQPVELLKRAFSPHYQHQLYYNIKNQDLKPHYYYQLY
jgi:hypothetical protein